MNIYEKLNVLSGKSGYYAKRLYAELEYLLNADEYLGLNAAADAEKVLDTLIAADNVDETALKTAENSLIAYSPKIKELTVIAAAHAHLDMNWMWRYDETVSTVLSTFRTILNFMEDYIEFTFSQSLAAVYEIVQKYAPEMLGEIQQRVKEGRWEVTASTWVEPDENMPSGETLARHMLYSRQFLTELFGEKGRCETDFEPDTFGHNANMPLILGAAGIKYFYYCRGSEKENVFNWKAGNASVLAYREPVWYNAEISYGDFAYVPKFAFDNGLDTLLKVYGVGDHGGGPTRRDIERLIDMSGWPLLPKIKFGTYAEFFSRLEQKKDTFPVFAGELNSFAAGCYTSQSRIKRFNKECEKQLYEAETFNALAAFNVKSNYDGKGFARAWENVLFNNFHDILPGSGTIDTREYALGKYQECLAFAESKKIYALNFLAKEIDTSAYALNLSKDSVSEGAGGGFDLGNMTVTGAERNSGFVRVYHLFNPTAYDITSPSVITLWDYDQAENIKITCASKNVSFQILDATPQFYWGHFSRRIAVDVVVPAFGYTTVAVSPSYSSLPVFHFPTYPRKDVPYVFEMENEYVKAVFDPAKLTLSHFEDKITKRQLSTGEADFEFVTEDPVKEMTAWLTGRFSSVETLSEIGTTKLISFNRGELISELNYTCDFKNSKLSVKISLAKNERSLRYECRCDFREAGVVHVSVPRLGFSLPCDSRNFVADIPFGSYKRASFDADNVCLNGAYAPDDGVFLISDSKYAFRCDKNKLGVVLIRNSYEPDPLPDYGISEFKFALGFTDNENKFFEEIALYRHPATAVSASNTARKGSLAESGSFLKVENALVSAVKLTENGEALAVRLYKTKDAVITCTGAKKGYMTDLCEENKEPLQFENDKIKPSNGNDVVTVCIERGTAK